MFGLSFVQAGFLFAGLAAIIPIAIHLLLKQRARRVDIGSIRFLQRVIRQHNRMRRLRQWLLLAARIITTLLLAMLFARPFLDRTAFEAGEKEIIFLLDRSASMGFTTKNDSTILEEAHAALRSELNQVHEKTVVRVALFDSLGVEEVNPHEEFDAPTASLAGTDYGKAIAWARDAIQQSTRPNKEVIIYSDLQKAGIGLTFIDDFPANIKLQLRDRGRSMSTNLSIERVTAVATEIRPKLPPTLEVVLRNGAPTAVDQVSVQLNLKGPDGKPLSQRKKISLKGFGRETVVFQIASAIPGNYTGAAEVLFPDELKFDNRRYVAFEARRPDRLLIVDGQEGSSVYASETYYLETALRVGSEDSDRDLPSFEIERIVWDNGTGFPDLTGFRVIALANVGHFSSEDASRLKDFLATGGRLLVCCGDQFTRRAAEPLANAGILPASLEGVASLGPYRISSWSKEHPILLPFDDPQYGDVRRLRFNKIARLEPNGDAHTLAQTPAGDPLIVESQVGEGKVLLWATTIDTAWTSFPRSRLFVPLTRQVFAYLTDQHVREHAIEELVANRRAGISRKGDRILVFNVAPEESELARVTPDEFRQAFGLPDKQELADLSTEQLAALAPPANSERPEEVWRTIAWILLGWLVVETFLAGRVHA